MAAVSRVQCGLVIILLCLQGSGDPFRLLPRDSAERKLLCVGEPDGASFGLTFFSGAARLKFSEPPAA